MVAIVAMILSDRYYLVILYPLIYQKIALKMMTIMGSRTKE